MNRRSCAVLLLLVAGGCAKAAMGTMAPEAADAAMAPGDGGGGSPSLADLQAQFDVLDADLSSEGILPKGDEDEAGGRATSTRLTPPAEPEPEPAVDGDAYAGDRCTRICGLKASICDLSERICALADDHDGEPQYADACTRASERCTQASEACTACEG
ncbi:MAG: hypothetical protein AAGA54_32055 [Myxococcota bacterium]